MPDPNELLAEMLAQAGGEDQQGTFPAAVPPLRPQPPPDEPAADLPMADPVVPRDPLMSLIGEGSRNIPPPPKEPTLKRTKKEMFRDMLSTFVYSLAKGMKESRGPGGNARGAAAALLAPYEREVEQHGMQVEARRVAVQEANQRSMEELRKQQEAAITPSIDVVGPNGEAFKIPSKDLGAYIGAGFRLKGAQIAATQKKETAEAQIASKEKIETQRLAVRKPYDEAMEAKIKAQTELVKAQTAGKPAELALKQQALRIAEESLGLRRRSLDLGEQNHELAVENLEYRIFGPTSNVKSRGQVAGQIRVHVPELVAQIERLGAQGKLGPLAGRITEFMAGKIGADDPEFIALRSNLGMFKSGTVMAHFGARGGIQMLSYFTNLIDAGRFGAENLKAAVGELDKYLKTYEEGAKYTPRNPKFRVETAPSGQYKVGDVVMYQGQKRTVKGIRPDGSLELQ